MKFGSLSRLWLLRGNDGLLETVQFGRNTLPQGISDKHIGCTPYTTGSMKDGIFGRKQPSF